MEVTTKVALHKSKDVSMSLNVEDFKITKAGLGVLNKETKEVRRICSAYVGSVSKRCKGEKGKKAGN